MVDSQISKAKFVEILFVNSLSRFFLVMLFDLFIYFLFSIVNINIELGWLVFLSSGVVFLFAGALGTLGTSISWQKIKETVAGEPSQNAEERKSNEDKAIGQTLINSVVGILLMITSLLIN